MATSLFSFIAMFALAGLRLTAVDAHGTRGVPQGTPDTTTATIDSLGWLAGCWEGSYANGRTVTEHWMPPAGNVMLGMSRAVKGGRTRETEFVKLERRDDGSIHYVAHPSGQESTAFRLVKIEGASAVFENPGHDYPQRILYRLVTPDSLSARIEGTIDGKEQSSDYPYRRVRCQ